MADGERVTIAIERGVADVRLARPEKLNALDLEMFRGLAAAITQLASNRRVRAVVLSGEGRAFCAGLDLEAMAATTAALRDVGARTHGPANLVQQAAWGWRTLPVPVIAAVGGVAFGGGFQIMLGADIRIADRQAEFAVMEARWGLVPDMGGMALMRGLVRDDVARELTYTARRFGAEEAARLGLVTRLADDPHAEALALARTIAGQSPEAIRAAKRLFALAADGDTAAILRAESVEQQALIGSPNQLETLAAAREKRAALFRD